jgi:hypothetical protein
MIRVEAGGRVRLVDGPVHHLQVHSTLRVYAGTKNSPERQSIHEDGFIEYVMARGVTYNILRPNMPGRTITDSRITSVMVDREHRSWTGEPDKWRPVRDTDPTLWTRLLDEEEDDG